MTRNGILTQIIQCRLNSIRHLRQTGHSLCVSGDVMGNSATDQGFSRRQYACHVRDLRHGESTVHGMDCTEKCIIIVGMTGDRCTLQPLIDSLQMAGDFRFQNFKQHRIDNRFSRRLSALRFQCRRHCRLGNGGNDIRRLLLTVINILTGRQALRDLIQTGKIQTYTFAGQGPVEYWQRGDGALDHHDDRVRNRP